MEAPGDPRAPAPAASLRTCRASRFALAPASPRTCRASRFALAPASPRTCRASRFALVALALAVLLDGAAFARRPPRDRRPARPNPPAAPQRPPPPGAPPDNPARNDLLLAMARVKPRVHACYDKLRVAGTIIVKLVVTSSGRVASVTASGDLAGTPTAACVEEAVRTAVFHPFKRERVTLTYPFILKSGDEPEPLPFDDPDGTPPSDASASARGSAPAR